MGLVLVSQDHPLVDRCNDVSGGRMGGSEVQQTIGIHGHLSANPARSFLSTLEPGMSRPEALTKLESLSRECSLLESIDALLGWDERTMLPEGGGAYRATQMKYLAGLIHEKRTSPQFADLLKSLADSDWSVESGSDDAATVKQWKRKVKRAQSQPRELVEELAEATVAGQQIWVQARKENSFETFRPALQRIVKLKQEQAAAIGFQENAYDALLDEYEPEATTIEIGKVLNELKSQLVPLIQQLADAPRQPDTQHLHAHFPATQQESFAKLAAGKIGFDFDRGRLDVTAHPFCTELGPADCRITTRYDEDFFNTAFFGVLHEAGHGIYEQGLRSDRYGLPSGMYCSLGIHESQSRLWENLVGRSRGFWEYFLPTAKSSFPEPLSSVSVDDFYQSINAVRPSLIRVEADEATYNLHIVIRFELEQQLISGNLPVEDLPSAWNQAYAEALGVTVDEDRNGCLQDVHWSAGLFGYFPTYTLGNLYAAQLFEAAEAELGDLDAQFAQGVFAPLKGWLQSKIYDFGQNHPAGSLVRMATGAELSSTALMTYLRRKLLPIYGIST